MSFSENKSLWGGLIAAVVLIGFLIWLLVSGGPLPLIILFPETGDLAKDDPVIWHDFVVGRVEKVEPLVDNQVGVTISLNEDYASRITHGTRFTLERATLFGFIGRNAIAIETPAESGLPFEPGEKVQGIAPPRPTVVEESKRMTREYWDQLKDEAARLLEAYRESPYKNEVEDAVAAIRTLSEEAARQAQESFEQFRKDHEKEFDQALEKLKQVREWMRKKGDEAGAARMQGQIDRLEKK